MISDDEVARVRAATDIVALVGEQVALKRSGTRFVGLCPFHQEKTPSFYVSADVGRYHCFGCSKGGDAITWVREVERLDFADAVRRLAGRAGITITEDRAAESRRQRRTPLVEALERAVIWYHERLLTAPDAGRARDYLRSRGYDGDVVRRFRLGWAPDEWDALARHLQGQRGPFVDAGLGFVNRAGRLQDAFRARIIFPIFDAAGQPVGLGGRVLPGTAGPKYKNSPETPVYVKRRTLYGLNWAKSAIVAAGTVVVCEGYTDVIGCHMAGVPTAVATCGTALGEEHFRELRRWAKRIVLAYDADAAGQAGAERLYEWEHRHEVDLAVAALPSGSDPGELAQREPERLREAVALARPFLEFRIERIMGAADLTTAEGRARAAAAAIDAVAEHPDELVRDQYVMRVADYSRLEPDALRHRVDAIRRAPRSPKEATPGPGSAGGSSGPSPRSPRPAAPAHGRREAAAGADFRPGLEALRLVVHAPALVPPNLVAALFTDPVQRRAFEAASAPGGVAAAIDRAESEDPEVARLLGRVAVEEPRGEPADTVILLVRAAARRALADMEADARLAPDNATLGREIHSLRADLDLLNEPSVGTEAAIDAVDRLVAWLNGRGRNR